MKYGKQWHILWFFFYFFFIWGNLALQLRVNVSKLRYSHQTHVNEAECLSVITEISFFLTCHHFILLFLSPFPTGHFMEQNVQSSLPFTHHTIVRDSEFWLIQTSVTLKIYSQIQGEMLSHNALILIYTYLRDFKGVLIVKLLSSFL